MKNVSRRQLLQSSGQLVVAGALLPTLAAPILAQTTTTTSEKITNPNEALRLLVEGNQRFQKGELLHPDQTIERRTNVALKQLPFSMIFACADSRESPEIVFDRGLGDLFVVRTAGHVLDAAAIGSLEYGTAELKIPLLVVLGHQRCGAVKATIEIVEKKAEAPGFIESLVKSIEPAMKGVEGEGNTKLEGVIKANTQLTIRRLLLRSKIISDAVARGELKIVGGRYDLDTGAVTLI